MKVDLTPARININHYSDFCVYHRNVIILCALKIIALKFLGNDTSIKILKYNIA